MKNFTKQNFKTNPLWIRLLIMAFMLLAGSGSAWAWTVYFDNSQTKWSNVYVVLGHDTYHRGDYKMTKVSNSDEIYYLTRDDWGDAKYITFSNSEIASGGSNNGFKTVITSGYDTFNNGASSLNHLFYSKVNNTISKNNDLYPRLVINCGLIGFYVGEYQNWGQSQFYVHSNGSGHISSYNTFDDGTTAKYGIIYAESKNYNVTHSTSWGGPTMGENAILGKRYLITGDNSVSTAAGTTLSCTFNIDKTIKAGETSTASVTSSGKSKYGTKNYAVDSYYIKKSGESTLTKLTISGNELQTQSLEVGTYTIYVLLYDGKIYAKGAEQTLTIETACITPDAPFGGETQSETICKGSPYEFDSNYKWYTGSTGETTVSGSKEIDSNTDYYIVNVAPEGCESARTKYTINVDEPLVAPTLIPTNPTTCNGNPTAGSIVIENYANYSNENSFALYKDENPTGIAYNNGFAISGGGDYKVVMTTSASNVCGQSVETEPISIDIDDVTPTVNPFEITLQNNACEGNPVTLSYNDTEQSGTVSYAWYEGTNREVLGTEKTFTIQQAKNATYKLVVTVTSNSCPANGEAEITVSPKAVPVAPTFDQDEMSACVGERFELPMPNNLIGEEEALWTVNGRPTNASQTINVADDYKYIAYKNDGCPSQGTEFIVHVNPLPAITDISVNNSTPVINEDVLLTVEGSDIARVEWSITSGKNASLSDASGNSVKLTSTTSGTVTVTATAISSNGCRATSTKEVIFKAVENCDPITDNTKIEIWCKVTGTTTPYCHAYNIKNSGNKEFKAWPGLTHTSKSGDYYIWTLDKTNGLDISNNKVGIVFSKNSSGNNQTADITTFYVGNRYYFTYNANSNDKNNNYTKGNSEPLTTYPPLSAPAVKTVSVTSEEGSGVVNFTGQIIKTGCAAKSSIYYGYQFKKADEEWPTTGVEASNTPVEGKLIPLTNASETALYYQFSANVENLEDVDYHFRAYIINGYDFTNGNYDQGVYYGLDKLVTVSTVQTAVKTAEIELVNQDGTSVEPGHKYCVGETGYIKVTSDVKYTTATWKSDLGVEIEQIGKTNIYQFEVKGKDQIVVLLSNKHNTEPVSSNPREVDVYASPSVPEIALGESSICDTNEDGTTLTVTRTKAGQYYALYKEDGNGGIKVEDYQLCSSDNAAIEYTGLKESAKYFVKTYRGECDSEITRSSSATLTVVDSKDVKISIEPTDTETTPWMPAKLTVTATSDYTVTSVPNDAVINISGNIVKVKLPLPTEGVQNKSTTKDNVNVTFDNITYTITAELRTAGEEGNPCAQPAIANITLTPYIEICD